MRIGALINISNNTKFCAKKTVPNIQENPTASLIISLNKEIL